MIILEILVGSDVVLAAQQNDEVEDLMEDCCQYIDKCTQVLL